MRENIERMAQMVEMAEKMILPSFSLGFSAYEDEAVMQVGGNAKKETFSTGTMAGTGAGLPIKPFYGTRDSYLRETRLKLSAIKEELKGAEAATRTMVRSRWFDLDTARREAALYGGEVISLSKSALEVVSRGYEAGSVSFADTIAAHTEWLNANLTYYRKQSDIGAARAELERVVGLSDLRP